MEDLISNTTISVSPLQQLHDTISGTVEVQDDVETLYLQKKSGRGKIRHLQLQEGLHVYDMDIILHFKTVIDLQFLFANTIQFMYCLHGECIHQFDTNDTYAVIEAYQTAVIHNDVGSSSYLKLPKEKQIIISIICINKKKYFDRFGNTQNQYGKRISKLLAEVSNKTKHFHLGGYNLKIAEQLRLILETEHENEISELLSQKGRYHLILAKHIAQFQTEIEESTNTSGLVKKELKKIANVSSIIQKHPEVQHSVTSLCHYSGLSPAKLQEGFKFIFQKTVSDYVRNIRLEKAEKLLTTTDLTISEIVYSIGLTSRSYFCKIFKKKYHYAPKEYRKKFF